MRQIFNLNELIVGNTYFLANNCAHLDTFERNIFRYKIKLLGFRVNGNDHKTLLTNYPNYITNITDINCIFEILEGLNNQEILNNNDRIIGRISENINILNEYGLNAHLLNQNGWAGYKIYEPEEEKIQKNFEQRNLKDILQKYTINDIAQNITGLLAMVRK